MRLSRQFFTVAVAMLVMATFMPAAAASHDGGPSMLQTDCDNPPAIMPVADVKAGMTGKAYTTLSGTEISEFDIEVIGILPGVIWPLIDLILIEVSGDAVEAAGGIAAGFSGSPVYIDDKLVGAIAYGFFGNSIIGGVTPAEDMVELVDFPTKLASPMPAAAQEGLAMIEARVGSLGSPSPLPVPLGVSGLSERWIDRLQQEIDSRDLNVILYPASGNHGGSGDGTGELRPGGSMSAVLSEGDFSAFGTGTATLCDGDKFIGWGHPFFWTGDVSMAMNDADVVTVVQDSTGFGNFKLVTLGENAGSIDFDGNAGIRGFSGVEPDATPITSFSEFAELDRSRSGRTDAYLGDDFFFSLGFTSAIHLLRNLDHVSGTGFRPGSSSVAWSVQGLRADGSPFTVTYDNKYWDPFSITDASVFEMANFIDQILFNPFEDVEITSVDVADSQLFSDRRTLDIREVRVSSDTNPEPVKGFGFIQAMPGDTITVEVDLEPFGGERFTETVTLEIPDDFAGGFGSLFVHGGSSEFFFFDPFFEGSVGDVQSLDDLLDFLRNRDHNYDLVVELDIFTDGGGEVPPEEEPPVGEEPEPPLGAMIDANGVVDGQDSLELKAVVEFDDVVTGNAFFDVEVIPDFEPPPPVFGTLFSNMSGDQVVGGGDPDSTGLAEFNFEGDAVFFEIALQNVDGPLTSAHIHAGVAGEDGPVVIDLDLEHQSLNGVVFTDPFLLEEILANPGGFYVQVHSEAYPGGAVRGQLAPDLVGGEVVEASALVYVASNGLWQVGELEPFFFGTPGDVPFMGDWDGDGIKTPGAFRPGNGFAYIRNSNDSGVADSSFFMGMKGDVPLVGDWDGDGADSFGVYRPSEGKFYLRNSNTTGFADVEFHFGVKGDVPFTGDFDGNGVTDIGLHRATTGLVYMRMTHTTGPADLEFHWGVAGDRVLAGDWDADGVDTIGLIRPSTGLFYLRNSNSLGVADEVRTLPVTDQTTSIVIR